MKMKCPDCEGPLIGLTSQNLKICADCAAEWDWPLEKNQRGILTDNVGGEDGSTTVDATTGGTGRIITEGE